MPALERACRGRPGDVPEDAERIDQTTGLHAVVQRVADVRDARPL